MKKIIVGLLAVCCCGTALADVQLVVRDLTGQTSTISSDGKKTRIDNPKMPGFAIIDPASDQIMVVDQQRREVLTTSIKGDGPGTAGAALSVSLEDRGGGQKIAGYLTRKYELIANGESCGTVYASSKLLKDNGVQMMFESMRSMSSLTRGVSGGLSGLLSVCQRATLQLGDAIESSGAPMRVLDAAGKTISEVISVETDKKFAGSHYAVPSGLKHIDMDERMNQAAQQMQQMQQNMPDMNQLMEQLQQGGGTSGEAMQQQMEKLQEMLQQLQKQ